MILRLLYLLIIAILLIGCEDDPASSAVDCVALQTTMTNDTTAYQESLTAGTVTRAECDTMVASVQAWFDGGCDVSGYYTQATIDELSTACASLPE